MPANNTDDHYARQLININPITEMAIKAAIAEFNPPPGSHGLDAGCGTASKSIWLADYIKPDGKVTGYDRSPGLLTHARKLVNDSGFSAKISLEEGNISNLPHDDNTFSWVWCCDTLWAGGEKLGFGDTIEVIKEFARVTIPGGMIAVVFWSSQLLLPGYPELESRLFKAFNESTFYTAGINPEHHSMKTLGWLDKAGLKNPKAKTFISNFHAPLSERIRTGLYLTLHMFFDGLEAHITADDWQHVQGLMDSGSRDYILNIDDYYGFITYTIFWGEV